MKKGHDNLYSMRQLNHRGNMIAKKRRLEMALLLLATILIILIITISQHIKKAQDAKAYQEQLVQYQAEQARLEQERIAEEERKRKEKIPQVTEQAVQDFESIYKSETKRAFLTFDDGPSPITPNILDTLKEKNVKATFFMLGSSVKNFPETVKRVYDEGHYIANHGYSHVYSKIYTSPQTVLDEYNQTNEAIKEAIGEPEFNSHLFRFPGGLAGGKYAEIKKQAKDLLIQNQIYAIDWNCLSGDAETSTPTSDYLMSRLQATSQGKNSLIILMHDAQAKKVTADTLPQIIDYLAGQGYEFKTFYDIF